MKSLRVYDLGHRFMHVSLKIRSKKKDLAIYYYNSSYENDLQTQFIGVSILFCYYLLTIEYTIRVIHIIPCFNTYYQCQI